MINFYTLWDDSKAILHGSDSRNVERPCSPDCEEKIAVLYIQPPSRNLRALCGLDYHDKLCNPYTVLLEDPISLCIIGGIQSKIVDFCTDHGKAHGNSFKYNTVLFVGFILAIVCSIPFLIRDSYFQRFHFFYWLAVGIGLSMLADKAHKTSAVYKNSCCQFWRSFSESDLESKISSMLKKCGYFYEIEANARSDSWTLSFYKKGGVQTSLPQPGDGIDDDGKDEESARKVWRISNKVGWFDDRAFNDNDEDDFASPLDLWAIRGLGLGRTLNSRKTQKLTQIVAALEACGMLVFFAVYPPRSALVFLAGFALIPLGLITIVIFNDLVDKPKYHEANEVLCRRFSPLIRDRYNGTSIHHEIRPYHCTIKKGVIVLTPPSKSVVVEPLANNDSFEMC